MSKGSARRPGDREAYERNYDAIFGDRRYVVRYPDEPCDCSWVMVNNKLFHGTDCKRA